MDSLRKPFQGVWNIVRFNWHFFLLSTLLAFTLLLSEILFDSRFSVIFKLAFYAIIGINLISLVISHYVYDRSNLFNLPWLQDFRSKEKLSILNINAGFDETSALIAQKFKTSRLRVLDFYDPEKHTEVSIERARKAYPPYPNTISIQTYHIELTTASADLICAILSAHEIRSTEERIQFFKELKRLLKPEGQIFVTEHLRDIPNFLAYTIGFFHFHSKSTWLKTFTSAGFEVYKEVKTTPFISTFILKHGTTP